MSTRPAVGSTMRNKVLMRVDLPQPVRPTMPIFSRGLMLRVRPFRTRSKSSLYLTYVHRHNMPSVPSVHCTGSKTVCCVRSHNERLQNAMNVGEQCLRYLKPLQLIVLQLLSLSCSCSRKTTLGVHLPGSPSAGDCHDHYQHPSHC